MRRGRNSGPGEDGQMDGEEEPMTAQLLFAIRAKDAVSTFKGHR